MRRSASLALLAAGLLLSGCSWLGDERTQPADPQEPPPPIEAMNEVLPAPSLGVNEPEIVFDQRYELELLCPGVEPAECKPPRERVEALRRQLRAELAGLSPAEGTPKRAIARLAVTPNAQATVIAWRARNGRLCTEIHYRYPDYTAFGMGGGFGPFGPCEPRKRCDQICLRPLTDLTDPKSGVVGGTVSSAADQLRVVFADGKAARYPLRGPIVAGFPEYRVFMLGLGRRLYRRLELLAGGEVRASVAVPDREIAQQRCFRRFPIPPPSMPAPASRAANRELQTCLQKGSLNHD
jgi:hypothetical protein